MYEKSERPLLLPDNLKDAVNKALQGTCELS
jgi:hypothetical protein